MLSSCHGLKRPHSVKLLFPSPHKCGKVHRSDSRVSRAPEIQSALDTIFMGAEMKSLLPEPFRCVQADGGGRAAARVSEQPPHQLLGRGGHRREVFSGEGKVASENIVGRLVVRVVKEGRKPAERLSNMYIHHLFPHSHLVCSENISLMSCVKVALWLQAAKHGIHTTLRVFYEYE